MNAKLDAWLLLDCFGEARRDDEYLAEQRAWIKRLTRPQIRLLSELALTVFESDGPNTEVSFTPQASQWTIFRALLGLGMVQRAMSLIDRALGDILGGNEGIEIESFMLTAVGINVARACLNRSLTRGEEVHAWKKPTS